MNDSKASRSPLLDKLGEAFQKGRDEVVRQAKVGRLSLDIRSLNSDRDALLVAIGGKAVEAFRAGTFKGEGLSSLMERLEAIEARIHELESYKGEVAGGLAESDETVQDAPSGASE